MKKILAVLLVLCCAVPAYAKKRQNEEIITPLTQLEKRQYQTRNYAKQDNIIVMKAVLNVLQDEGFIVYNVNSLLGYIYGVKDFDTSDPNIDISKEFGLTKSRLSYNGVKVATLEVGVNITQYGENSRLRVNFKRKLLNEYGNAQMINDIDEIEYYDNFYSKVDDAIALQKQFYEKLQNNMPEPSQKQSVKTQNLINDEPKDIIKEEKQTEETENIPNENVDIQKQAPQDVIDNTQIEVDSQEQAVPEDINGEIQIDAEKPNSEASEISQDKKEDTKELKELLKQAKEEAKQAQKAAKQAQKETLEIQKNMEKESRKILKQLPKDE